MTDPYSDDRNANNPFAYYEEDTSLPDRDYDAEPPADREPRTPFSLTLQSLRHFQLTTQYYRLIVLQDRCELMLKDIPTGFVVLRDDAADSIWIKGSKIVITDESGRKHRFSSEGGLFTDPSAARLVLWAASDRPTDPMAAYHAVQEILVKDFFRWFFQYSLFMITAIIFTFLTSGWGAYADQNTGFAVIVILLSYLLFYIAFDVLLYWNRKLVFSRIVMFLPPLFAVLILIGSFLFGFGVFMAVLGSIPAFWFFIMHLAFHDSLRQLKTDNAELFL